MTIAIGVVFIVANTAFVAIRDECTEKDTRLQTSATSLETQLKAVLINNSSPSEVKVLKNGDCLTANGVVGTASFFKFPYSNTAEANEEVAKSLHSVASQDTKPFILGDDNGDGFVEFIQTELFDSVGKETYEAKYYLHDAMACPDHEYGSGTCIKGETSDDIHSYMSKPINKIELSLRRAVN